jgi:hypothetical protein
MQGESILPHAARVRDGRSRLEFPGTVHRTRQLVPSIMAGGICAVAAGGPFRPNVISHLLRSRRSRGEDADVRD